MKSNLRKFSIERKESESIELDSYEKNDEVEEAKE